MVAKALEGRTGADAVVVDLEDGVPSAARDEAVATMLSLYDADAAIPVYCRIRSPLVEALEDLALVPRWFAGTVLAKAEEPAVVAAVSGASRGRELWLLIESARGVERLGDLLAAASIDGVMLGGTDLRADLGARRTDDEIELLYARGRMVSISAAHGIRNVVDTPEAAIDDPEGLEGIASRVRALGFTGKACIHPKQVPVVQASFAPSVDEIEWARSVLKAVDGAQRVGGELVDEATKRIARTILAERAAQD